MIGIKSNTNDEYECVIEAWIEKHNRSEKFNHKERDFLQRIVMPVWELHSVVDKKRPLKFKTTSLILASEVVFFLTITRAKEQTLYFIEAISRI